VNLPNADGRLLPGMTATVQFLTATADNVLTVPNAALRIRPTAEMLSAVERMNGGTVERKSGDTVRAPSDSARNRAAGFRGNRSADQPLHRSTAQIWYLDSAGALHAARVRVGLSDGQRTEVTSPALYEGMQIVTGLPVTNDQAAPAAAGSTNPLQPQRGGGPGGGRRGF